MTIPIVLDESVMRSMVTAKQALLNEAPALVEYGVQKGLIKRPTPPPPPRPAKPTYEELRKREESDSKR